MLKKLFGFGDAEPIGNTGVDYIVKVDGYTGGEYHASFNRRDDARQYKRALNRSKQNLHARIFKVEFDAGFMLGDPKEVY